MATTPTSTAETAADPWFQDLFAQRIGGAGYGKGNEIYKFELIKRAKRQALAEHPERRMLDFGMVRTTKWPPKASAR
jgi:LL-diaminopimelate aminotransferase